MEPFPLVLVVVAGFAFVASEFQSKPTVGFQDSLIEETSDEANANQLKPTVGFQDSLIEETSDGSNARHGYHCYTVSFKGTGKPYYTLAQCPSSSLTGHH